MLVPCSRVFFFVIILFFLKNCFCDLDKSMKTVKYCIRLNNRTLNTDRLIGTWYTIYKFAYGLSGMSSYCATTNFTSPTKAQLDEYKLKYNLANETFSFDDGAILSSQIEGRLKGIIVGNKTAKYYFFEPKSRMRLTEMYEVQTFKPVNDEYLIFYKCSMRGHVKFLWSRRNNQTDAELAEAMRGLYEVADMQKERYCFKREVSTTTEYF